MFVYINFAVREHDIHGYIAMIMDLPSLTALKHLLNEFIARTTGELARSEMIESARDLLAAAFKALDSGVAILDRERRLIGRNEWLSSASGISPNDATNKTLN